MLRDVLERRTPVKEAVRDWGKKSRFAGARDRAWISGLVVDALRRKNSIEHAMEATGARVLALGALKHAWGWDVRKIEEALKDEHAPAADERQGARGLLLAPDPSAPPHVRGRLSGMARAASAAGVRAGRRARGDGDGDARADRPAGEHAEVGCREGGARAGRRQGAADAGAAQRLPDSGGGFASSAARRSRRSRLIPKAGSKCRTWAARSRRP